MSDQKQQPETVKCSYCGRPLADLRGASRLELRCPDCCRTTRYYDRKSLDKEPQSVVYNR